MTVCDSCHDHQTGARAEADEEAEAFRSASFARLDPRSRLRT